MRCGAKTRSGAPCKSRAMPNGRCRMHGGTASKTHKGNQNARTHGIYSNVLTDQEKALWIEVELGKVDDELRLCRIRLVRALEAEKEATGLELEVRTEKPMMVGGVPVTDEDPVEERTYRRRDYPAIIDKLMGRIESLERTRQELSKGAGSPDVAKALADAIASLPD